MNIKVEAKNFIPKKGQIIIYDGIKETDYNLNRLYSGVNNNPILLEESKEAAYQIGKKLKVYNLDIAYISPLLRAKETFFEINKTVNIPFLEDEKLIERNFKNYEGKEYETFNYSICWDVEKSKDVDIESIDDMVIRIEKVLKRIKEEAKDKNVLIVAHSGTCRVIRYIIEGKKEKDLRNYKMDNLQMYVYNEW